LDKFDTNAIQKHTFQNHFKEIISANLILIEIRLVLKCYLRTRGHGLSLLTFHKLVFFDSPNH